MQKRRHIPCGKGARIVRTDICSAPKYLITGIVITHHPSPTHYWWCEFECLPQCTPALTNTANIAIAYCMQNTMGIEWWLVSELHWFYYFISHFGDIFFMWISRCPLHCSCHTRVRVKPWDWTYIYIYLYANRNRMWTLAVQVICNCLLLCLLQRFSNACRMHWNNITVRSTFYSS